MTKTVELTEEQYEKVAQMLGLAEAKKYEAVSDLVGTNVFIRTVTHYFTGHIEKISGQFMVLSDAAWIADTGRYADALKTGKMSEVEPIGDCMVNMDSIVDITPWRSGLPLTQQ